MVFAMADAHVPNRWGLVSAVAVLLFSVGCSEKQSQVSTNASTTAAAPASASANAAAPTSADPSDAEGSPAAAASAGSGPPVGTAKLEEDGTLVLTLYTRGPMHGQTQKKYAKDDPKREEILKHVGGLKPGEEKLVPPWPDDIDDARVDEAVKKHIAKESWADGARITITGTDKEGRIAVTAHNAKPPRQGVSLRLDPKTYAVVKDTPINR